MSKLPDRLFRQYCELVYRESGIHLTDEKRELLNARLAKRLRSCGGITPGDYLDRISRNPDELRAFLDAISTNHTFFFRESKSFKYLERSRREIWCAASSSGEEPYSLALHALDQGFQPGIWATDIADSVLEKARRGIYPKQAVANIPMHLLKTYFQRGQDKWADHVRVKESVRRLIRFDRFNLLKDNPPASSFDMIFCRNVMIYFDNPTKEWVVAKLGSVLKPGGYFIIGGAESLSGLNHGFKYVEPSVYLKA